MEQLFCTKCGNRLKEGALFCNQCGARIARPDAGAVKEGTMLLIDQIANAKAALSAKKGELQLTPEERANGVSKVIDFGTGARYRVDIPRGIYPGSTVVVKGTGIKDPDTGADCEIELTIK
ncbi:MAG: zinc ribbon domain-containing protein [Mogibacterium sp.]|nr:zinc ribbon domain-containing protein [Mogibacterium sp.]